MRSLKVILSLILSVCLWSEASAACAMKWKFLEENYNPTYQVCTILLCIRSTDNSTGYFIIILIFLRMMKGTTPCVLENQMDFMPTLANVFLIFMAVWEELISH